MPKPPRKRTAAVGRLRITGRQRVRTLVKKKPSAALTRARQREVRILTPEELKILRLEREYLEALKATLKGLGVMKRELIATVQDLEARILGLETQVAEQQQAAEEDQSIVEDVGDFLWDVVKTVSPVDLGSSPASRPATKEEMMLISLMEQVAQVRLQLQRVETEIKRCRDSIQKFQERKERARDLPQDSVLRAMATYRGR